MGRLSASIDNIILYLSKAIELDPGFAEAYDLRGAAYRMKKQPELALADFNQAILLNPR